MSNLETVETLSRKSDPFLSQAAAEVPFETIFSGAAQVTTSDVIPVLDMCDPIQLMQLVSTGDLLMEPVDNTTEITTDNSPLMSQLIDEVFLPPKIQSREINNNKQQ